MSWRISSPALVFFLVGAIGSIAFSHQGHPPLAAQSMQNSRQVPTQAPGQVTQVVYAHAPAQSIPQNTAQDITQDTDAATVCVEVQIDGRSLCASGVAITPKILITNYHVIEASVNPIAIVTRSGNRLSAEVIKESSTQDLALLQLKEDSMGAVAKLGSLGSADIQVGESVSAIGYPGGIERKTSSGQILSLNGKCDRPEKTTLERCLELSPGTLEGGNSGGALVNSQGDLIGINRALKFATRNGVAIPIEEVLKFAED